MCYSRCGNSLNVYMHWECACLSKWLEKVHMSVCKTELTTFVCGHVIQCLAPENVNTCLEYNCQLLFFIEFDGYICGMNHIRFELL
jgi:hypothetical protein